MNFNNLLEKDDSEERFFGFLETNNGIKFKVPSQLYEENISYLNFRKYIDILVKYEKTKKTDILIDSNSFSKEINNKKYNIILSLINILNDYLNYGEFDIKTKETKNNQIKINWNKTFKKNETILINDDVIYNTFSNVSIKDQNDVFFQLYQQALGLSLSILMGIPTKIEALRIRSSEIKSVLNNKLRATNKDRDVFIALNLKQLYLNLYNQNNVNDINNINLSVHYKFENIWESMISSILRSHHYPLNIQNGTYSFPNKKDIAGLNLKHDHLVKIHNNYFLMDSKFYNSYYNQDYPKSESIAKQVLYKHVIENQLLKKGELGEGQKLYNMFIFPKNNKSNPKPELFNIHNLELDGTIDFKIYCIAVDINEVINSYLNNKEPSLVKYIENFNGCN